MSDPPEQNPAVLAVHIKQLQKAITELGAAVDRGFERLERKLDERLASRDERLDEHEERIRAVEARADRKDGRDTVLAWLGGTVGGTLIAGMIGLWLVAFQNGLVK